MRFFNVLSTNYRQINAHRATIGSKTSAIAPARVEYMDVLLRLKNNCFSVRIYTPCAQSSLYPTIFYIPGSAFIATEDSFTHVFCSYLVEKTGYQVIRLTHRLAPEYQFPAAYKDVFNLFCYFVEQNPGRYNIDTGNVIVSGYSSGGNLASLLAIKKTKKVIARQILISPMVDLARDNKGFDLFEDMDSMPEHRKFVAWMNSLYIPGMNPHCSLISPYWTSKKQLSLLPPTDIIFGEFDLVRGDCELYKQKLSASGVYVSGSYMFEHGDHSLLWKRPIDIADVIGSRIVTTVERPLINVTIIDQRKCKNIIKIIKMFNQKQNALKKSSTPCDVSLVLRNTQFDQPNIFKRN